MAGRLRRSGAPAVGLAAAAVAAAVLLTTARLLVSPPPTRLADITG